MRAANSPKEGVMRHFYFVFAIAGVLAAGCSPSNVVFSGDTGTSDGGSPAVCDPLTAKVDLLFLVDNSGSMSEEQANLASNLATFLAGLETVVKDYHIGVITTDYTFDPFGATCVQGGCVNGLDCTKAGTGGLAVKAGSSYCTKECTTAADCPQFYCNTIGDCTPAYCGHVMGFDKTKSYCYPAVNGRLRACAGATCTDYSGAHQTVLSSDLRAKLGADSFTAMFRDNVKVGTSGSGTAGFEQGLNTMRAALDPTYVDPITGANLVGNENAGFIRSDARLVVIFVSDEEDCSFMPNDPNIDLKKSADQCYPNPMTCHPDCQQRKTVSGNDCYTGETAVTATEDKDAIVANQKYCMITCTADADCQTSAVSGQKCATVPGFGSTIKYCYCNFSEAKTNDISASSRRFSTASRAPPAESGRRRLSARTRPGPRSTA